MPHPPPADQPKVPVAVAWYAPEQWERWKEVVEDPQNFEETHAEWQGAFIRGVLFLRDEGFDPHKIPVDIDELVEWCRRNKRPIDSGARSEFAADKLRAQLRPPSAS